MHCVICKNGQTKAGKVTTTLQRGEAIIVFKEVPADVCDNCGEYYLSKETTKKLLHKAETAVKSGAIVEIQKFAA
ncbi:MAG: type II toxin-antitoxin system MqsA family antitoxin [Calditrichaeota bacterium]|nr:MAG: type II toxin-antitoxin system MqsA family antitoxin [Calditrichota bacterium]MBL1205048.1 type II toxin-antitoxin system MqsA family antitoxin [Calditrichota bacterium]NOG44878.1 type II toxin-antitoxin system MqsA family antitoxin [Calditrichota bacterium]